MARASAIWTVETNQGLCIAAFTVKRECAEWMLKQKEHPLEKLLVQRFHDGGTRVTDLVAGLEFVEAYRK